MLFPATPLRRQPPEATTSRVQAEIAQIRVENAALRDELRKLEDRQRILLRQVQGLQRACNGASASPVADGARTLN
jgi:hypothetical protein